MRGVLLQVVAQSDPFPFTIFDVATVLAPVKDRFGDFNKKRHWLILGPPDIGKSRWVNQTFAGKAVFIRPATETPFEYGSYCQQQVIIYDDFVPKWEEFVAVSNVHNVETHVPGRSRYRPNYFREGQARVIIWLLNPFNLPSYAKDDKSDERQALFEARFNVLRWNARDKEWYVF